MPRGSSVSHSKFVAMLSKAGCKVGNVYGLQRSAKFVEILSAGQQTFYLLVTKSYELIWPTPIKQLYDLSPSYANLYSRTQSVLAKCRGISVTGELLITDAKAWALLPGYSQAPSVDVLTSIQEKIREIEQTSGHDILPEDPSGPPARGPLGEGGAKSRVELVDNFGQPIEEVFTHIVGPRGPPEQVEIPRIEESERLSFEVGVLYPLVTLNEFYSNLAAFERYLAERKAECGRVEMLENDLAFREIELKLIKLRDVMVNNIASLQTREAELVAKAKKLEGVYQSSKIFSDSPVSLNQQGLKDTMAQASAHLRTLNVEIIQVREDIKRQIRSYQEGLDCLLE